MRRIGLRLAVSACLSLPSAAPAADGSSPGAGPVASPFLGSGLLAARFQVPGENGSLLARLGSEAYAVREQASVQARALVQGLFQDCVRTGLAIGDPLRVDDCLERAAAELEGMMDAAADPEVHRRLELALQALQDSVRGTYSCYCNVVCENPRFGRVHESGLTFDWSGSQSCRSLPSESDALERYCNLNGFPRQGLLSASCYLSAQALQAAAPKARPLDPQGPRPPRR